MDITPAIEKYIAYRSARELPQQGRSNFRTALRKHFVTSCQHSGCQTIEALDEPVLKYFQEEVHFAQTSQGLFLQILTQNNILRQVKSFLKWLADEDYLSSDLSPVLEYYKLPKRLPKNILDETQMHALLEACETETHIGYRNRIILEIFYGTGIRAGELMRIKVSDVDLNQKTLFIDQGKGRKDRLVPLGQGLTQMLRHYIQEIRPKLMVGQHDYLIASHQYPAELKGSQIGKILDCCAKKAGIKQRVYPHLLRHACATHMIRRGAPLRHIQELLGHASVVTTQVYTHVTITDLKKAHARYHPRERKKKEDDSPAHPSNKGGP